MVETLLQNNNVGERERRGDERERERMATMFNNEM